MKISIIGSGKVGAALGRGWARAGHMITYGSRQPDNPRVQELVLSIGTNACAATLAEAAAWGEVVVLAIPWRVTLETLHSAGSLAGKVVIDATNPLVEGRQLAFGFNTSAGEQVAQALPGAHVVKAFNTTGAGNLANANYHGQQPSMFLCGDDENAKAVVARLAGLLGFEPVDCGPLSMARALEPLALLWVNLVSSQGLGPNIAFKLLRR